MSLSSDRRSVEAGELREKILDAADGILAEDGMAGLSVRKLAERIGHTTGTIYHHFRDKEEVVSALIGRGRERIARELAPLGQAGDPREALWTNLRSYTFLMLGQRATFQALFLGPGASTPMLAEEPAPGTPLAALAQFFGEQVRSGRFRPLDPGLTARMVWTAWSGLLVRLGKESVTSQDTIDFYAQELFEILWRGMEARPQ